MSVFQSLVLGKTFDSYDDVLAVIQQVSDQDNIYLRREKTQTIESFNNRKDVSICVLRRIHIGGFRHIEA